MPGLVPGIQGFNCIKKEKTWMAGTKPGHDEKANLFQGGAT
jgi:hypothetical protein